MAEIDRSLIGTVMPAFEVEVERGAIRKFAIAIGDPNPLYRDVDHARAHGFADLLAPPTFPVSFRPPDVPPWMADLDWRRIVAGEVAFDYVRPVVAGMRLDCRFAFAGLDEKRGSKGTMELIRQELRVSDADGPVLTCHRTTVYRSLEQVEKRTLA